MLFRSLEGSKEKEGLASSFGIPFNCTSGKKDQFSTKNPFRHLLSALIGILASLRFTEVGALEKTTISHLVHFNFRKFAAANSRTMLVCALSTDSDVAKVRISSPCKEPLAHKLLINGGTQTRGLKFHQKGIHHKYKTMYGTK